jgi:hypothetical protein
MKKYLFLLVLVCSQVVGQTTLFQQDFNGAGPFTSATPNNGQFDSFITSSGSGTIVFSQGSIVIEDSKLKFNAAGGIGNCGPPYYTGCTGTTGGSSANRTSPIASTGSIFFHQRFTLSSSNSINSNDPTASANFNFKFGGFSANGNNSLAANGRKFTFSNNVEYDLTTGITVEVFANNTAALQTYLSPNNISETIPNGQFDIWFGNTKVYTNVINSIDLTQLSFVASGYSSGGLMAYLDDILIESLAVLGNPPCPSTLSYQNLTDDFPSTPSPSLKKASISIIATNQITGNGTNVSYQAGNKVELNAGFKADNGTVFLAQIGGCN